MSELIDTGDNSPDNALIAKERSSVVTLQGDALMEVKWQG
jgi:hypothetical protein